MKKRILVVDDEFGICDSIKDTLQSDYSLAIAYSGEDGLSILEKSLEDLVKEGEFREDLFYRVNVFPIRLPSLRERVRGLMIEVFLLQQAFYRDVFVQFPPMDSYTTTNEFPFL